MSFEFKNIDQDEKLEQEIVSIFTIFVLGQSMILSSHLYYEGKFLYMCAPGDLLVTFILGFLNSLIDFKYFFNPRLQLLYRVDERKRNTIGWFKFISTIFLYMGLYQTLLLPMGGIGTIEFIFTVLMFACVLMGIRFNKIYSINHKMIFFWQIVLFIIKIISLFISENLYQSFFDGNPIGRNFILFSSLVAGYFLIKRKMKIIDESKYLSIFEKIGGLLGKLLKFLVTLITKLLNFLLSIALSPYILIIVAVIIIVGIPIGEALFLESVRENILEFIEPVLRGLLSTGKYRIPSDPVYELFQILTMIIYSFYIFSYYRPYKVNECKNMVLCYKKKDFEDLTEEEKKFLDDIKLHNMDCMIYQAVCEE